MKKMKNKTAANQKVKELKQTKTDDEDTKSQ